MTGGYWTLTGASGFIGRRLQSLLKEERAPFHTVSQNEIRGGGPAELAMWLGESNVLVHMAGLTDLEACEADPRACKDANTRSFQIALEAAAMAGLRRVVFLSTMRLYGTDIGNGLGEDATPAPFDAYGKAKLAAEQAAHRAGKEHGIETVVLRVASVYGPGADGGVPDRGVLGAMGRAAESVGVIQVYGDGRQTKDLVHVDDVARAIRAAGTWPGGDRRDGLTFNVGSGRGVAVQSLADHIAGATGATIEHVPSEGPDVTGHLDCSRAHRVLDWWPRRDLATELDRWWPVMRAG